MVDGDSRSVCAYGRLTPTTRLALLVYGCAEGLAKSAGTGVSHLGGRPVQTSKAPFQDSESRQWMVNHDVYFLSAKGVNRKIVNIEILNQLRRERS
ncbi:hypothetical protein [Chamaesiphon sp.]|uniref:hypothetical protein n=1 Tax=Chamaesiphon sp. TaxID=2814140 RepID=UPI003593B5EC